MARRPGAKQSHGEKAVKDIRRATRKQYSAAARRASNIRPPRDAQAIFGRRATRKQCSAEEKTRIVLDGLKGEDSVAELCRREGQEAPRGCLSVARGFATGCSLI